MINYLDELKKEYKEKKLKALKDCETRKEELYLSIPRLAGIDRELSNYSINIAKNILSNPNSSDISNLKDFSEKLKQEKLALLKKHGKDLSCLEPIFECPICKDEGYIIDNYKNVMCNCLKQELYNVAYNKSNIGNLEKENFSAFNLELYSNEINKQKYNYDISPRENIERIKNIAESFIKNFDDPDEKNLILMGNSGLGKTFLSNCIANEILKNGKTVLYQTAPNMLSEIMNCVFDKPNCNKDIIENLLNVDLLIIDDFGTETMNSMKFTELFNILNSRLLNQNKKIRKSYIQNSKDDFLVTGVNAKEEWTHVIAKTIISTNLTLQNIYEIYDERIVSRIVGYYNVCKFFGDDIRFKKG